MKAGIIFLFWCGALGAGYVPAAGAGDAAAWQLPGEMQVDGRGVFLADVLSGSAAGELPRVQIAPAPAVGKTVSLTRTQINDLLVKNVPQLATTNWSGPDRVRITRRVRSFEETELKDLLTATLQKEEVRDKGELDLRLMRPWAPVTVPDETITLKVMDLPVAGVTPNFIARFELRAGTEVVGSWQVTVQARVLREVWVARSSLMRGQLLKDADLTKERRDVLVLRDVLGALPQDDGSIELAENVSSGMPLAPRLFRQRPVVLRGKVVEAFVQDGSLTISTKVEVLEDGVPGQTVRVRNLQSKREFRGKVQNEATVLVTL